MIAEEKKIPFEAVAEQKELAASEAASDSIAAVEEKSIADGNLDGQAKQLHWERSQIIKEQFHSHLCEFVTFGAFALKIMMAMWIYHLLTPPEFHLLPAPQLDRLHNIIFTGLVVTLFKGQLDRYLE